MRFRAHGRRTGPGRIMEPLVGRMLRKQFTEQVATLKRLLEEAPVAVR